MNKKILYITYVNRENYSHKGFEKKIDNQWKAFNLLENVQCDLIFLRKNNICLLDVDNSETEIGCLTNKFERTMKYYNKILKNIDLSKYSHIYLRYPMANKDLIDFFERTKEKNIVNITEIVTYPYDGEMKNSKGLTWIKKQLDLHYRKQLKKYVDYIVTFSNDKEIFEIPCINISNGISLEQLRLIEKKDKAEGVIFTSVASYEYWHGIDRFLISLETYLQKKSSAQVKFNIVGEGSETPKLKQFVNDSKHLKDVVVFHGFKSGGELDAIYNETDIAIGSLGRHRSGLTSLKTLKNREYAAKGLPMIYSEIDPDFEGQPFVYKTTPDEELIDIKNLIAWYQNLFMQPEEIREYAKQFSWDIQMKKVIDVIEAK